MLANARKTPVNAGKRKENACKMQGNSTLEKCLLMLANAKKPPVNTGKCKKLNMPENACRMLENARKTPVKRKENLLWKKAS